MFRPARNKVMAPRRAAKYPRPSNATIRGIRMTPSGLTKGMASIWRICKWKIKSRKLRCSHQRFEVVTNKTCMSRPIDMIRARYTTAYPFQSAISDLLPHGHVWRCVRRQPTGVKREERLNVCGIRIHLRHFPTLIDLNWRILRALSQADALEDRHARMQCSFNAASKSFMHFFTRHILASGINVSL